MHPIIISLLILLIASYPISRIIASRFFGKPEVYRWPDDKKYPSTIQEHYTELFWIAPHAFLSSRENHILALLDTEDEGIVLAFWNSPCNPNCAGYWIAPSYVGEYLEFSTDEIKRIAILGKEETL
jgi:hypothetical protein